MTPPPPDPPRTRTFPVSSPATRDVVLGLAHLDGTLVADEVHTVAGALGLGYDAVRQCLARLVADGHYRREGRGTAARFTVTDDGRKAVDPELPYLELVLDYDHGQYSWDGVWHLALFRIPEARRALRDSVRRSMIEQLGAAALGHGLYAHPLDWDPLVEQLAAESDSGELLTLAAATRLRRGGVEEPAAIASQLWPIDEIGGRWTRLVDSHRSDLAQLVEGRTTPIEAVAMALAYTAAFDACLRLDPLLPPELLPPRWPGAEARRLLLEIQPRLDEARRSEGFDGVLRRHESILLKYRDPASPQS